MDTVYVFQYGAFQQSTTRYFGCILGDYGETCVKQHSACVHLDVQVKYPTVKLSHKVCHCLYDTCLSQAYYNYVSQPLPLFSLTLCRDEHKVRGFKLHLKPVD